MGAGPAKLAAAAGRGDHEAVEAILARPGGPGPNCRAALPEGVLPRACLPPGAAGRRMRGSASATLARTFRKRAARRRPSAPAGPERGRVWAPLQLAAAGGHRKACEALLDRGAALNVGEHEPLRDPSGIEPPRGATPLHLAVRGGHVAVARLLLARGADPSPGHRPDAQASASEGAGYRTPLHEAAAANHAALCGVLLDFGASPWADPVGRAALAPVSPSVPDGSRAFRPPPSGTPLDETRRAMALAASRGGTGVVVNVEVEAMLADAQRDAPKPPVRLAFERDREILRRWWASDQSRALRLCEAARSGDVAAVREELEGGARPELMARLKNVSGANPPLLYAASGGHEDVCRMLLDAGAQAGQENERGSQALHLAARSGCGPALCSLLLRHGADPRAPTSAASGHKTAGALARESGFAEVANMLEAAEQA